MAITSIDNLLSDRQIKIMIIDDHEMVRTALRFLIERQPDLKVVCEGAGRDTAIPAAAKEQPDIILLDLDLGNEDGVELIPDLLAAAKNARIIALTGVQDSEIHNRAILSGAIGLLSKEKSADTLLKAIWKVYMGEAWLDPHIMASVLSEFSRQKENRKADPETVKIASLTKREREIIKLVAEGLQNRQIAERLNISISTVRHHLTSIFDKLDIANRFELIIYSYRHGLALQHDS